MRSCTNLTFNGGGQELVYFLRVTIRFLLTIGKALYPL